MYGGAPSHVADSSARVAVQPPSIKKSNFKNRIPEGGRQRDNNKPSSSYSASFVAKAGGPQHASAPERETASWSSPTPKKSTTTKRNSEERGTTPSSCDSQQAKRSTRSNPQKGLDVEEAQKNAKKRVRERKLREQEERQKELLNTESHSRRRHSDITAEEGRARARARVRFRQLQKKALGSSPDADNETLVSNVSIQEIMEALDMDTESCRSYIMSGVHEDDHSVASSIATRSVTVPNGPKLLLQAKYGEKTGPHSRSVSRSRARGGLHMHDDDNSNSNDDDSLLAPSLAQSNLAFENSLRKNARDEDSSTWYEGRVTVPKAPKFHTSKRSSSRPPPKSTEELEVEEMKQHQFKARPLPNHYHSTAATGGQSSRPWTGNPDQNSPSKQRRPTATKSTTLERDRTYRPRPAASPLHSSPHRHLSEARRIAKGLPATA